MQLEARRGDYAAGALNRDYFARQVAKAGQAVARAEVGSAPAGWTCVWDDPRSRYTYFNKVGCGAVRAVCVGRIHSGLQPPVVGFIQLDGRIAMCRIAGDGRAERQPAGVSLSCPATPAPAPRRQPPATPAPAPRGQPPAPASPRPYAIGGRQFFRAYCNGHASRYPRPFPSRITLYLVLNTGGRACAALSFIGCTSARRLCCQWSPGPSLGAGDEPAPFIDPGRLARLQRAQQEGSPRAQTPEIESGPSSPRHKKRKIKATSTQSKKACARTNQRLLGEGIDAFPGHS
jgi:hypothetical protein